MARILLADDDDALRELIREFLASRKHEVAVAEDGAAAAKLAAEKRPDLLILDLNRPGLKGNEAFRSLDEDFTRETPVIFISGLPALEARKLAFLPLWSQGRLLSKPVDLAKLEATVAELLSRKKPS